MQPTEPESSYPVLIDDKPYTVDILLDSSHAKIWKIDNFITDEECDILVKHGKPLLHRATVAAEDGSSVVSENRKAQQASYNLHHQHPETDPLFPLFDRVLSITNAHANYSLVPAGQEDFTIIQYNVADQYTPHCDGNCDGTLHQQGGRIATAVLYCKVSYIFQC